MRKLASIQKIKSLTPIKDADKIELATVLGWHVIVSKNDGFKVGDKVVYFEIDSILPDIPEFEFLKKRTKLRVKTIKLRGVISQGLIISIEQARKIASDFGMPLNDELKVGDDISNNLKVEKYEEYEDEIFESSSKKSKNPLMRFAWYRKLFAKPKVKKEFPSDCVSITDEPRIQTLSEEFEKWRDEKIPFTITEKCDGMSATYVLKKGKKKWFGLKDGWEFIVASRKLYVGEDDSAYWKMARKYKIEEQLKRFYSYLIRRGYRPNEIKAVALQGEICGPKIQSNRLKLSSTDLFIFNICITYFDGKQEKLNPTNAFINSGIKMGEIFHNMKFVPNINMKDDVNTLPNTIDELIDFSKGNYSIWNVPREGLVFRNYEHNISFKVINPDYLIRYDC